MENNIQKVLPLGWVVEKDKEGSLNLDSLRRGINRFIERFGISPLFIYHNPSIILPETISGTDKIYNIKTLPDSKLAKAHIIFTHDKFLWENTVKK